MRSLFALATRQGRTSITIISGDLHESVDFNLASHPNQMPSVCNIMTEFVGSEDVVLERPPKGRGSRLKIQYRIPRAGNA